MNAQEFERQYEAWVRVLNSKVKDSFGPMREATPEEQKSVEDYVKSISVNTGVKFF